MLTKCFKQSHFEKALLKHFMNNLNIYMQKQ